MPHEGGDGVHDDAVFEPKFLWVDRVVVVFSEGVGIGGILAGIWQFFDGSNNGLGEVGFGGKDCHGDCGDKRNFHLGQYELDGEGVAVGHFGFVEIGAGGPICCVD